MVPFRGGYKFGAEGYGQGRIMRGGAAASDPYYYKWALERGYPPGKRLGGSIGEDVWMDLSKTALREKGLPVPDRVDEEIGLPLMIDYVAKNNGEILFVLHEGIRSGTTYFTNIELQHILKDPAGLDLLSKTIFIVDWYY